VLLVAVTQLIFFFKFYPSDSPYAPWVLSPPKIYYFTIVTCLITSAGYLINDYFDDASDRANDKPHKLSKYHSLLLYGFLLMVGMGMSLHLAHGIGHISFAMIYVGATSVLYLYSAWLKKTVLWGNLTVALFTAGVLLIFAVAELSDATQSIKLALPDGILFFSVFSFLINLFREIIKDIQDYKGDMAAGYLTLPIRYGVKVSTYIAGMVLLILISSVLTWHYSLTSDFASPSVRLLLMSLFLYIPLLILGRYLIRPGQDWQWLSRAAKGIMIFGLILVFLFY